MKKFVALAAVAVLFAGCDIVGGSDGPVASVASITITDADFGGATNIAVEVQSLDGRAIYSESFSGPQTLPLQLDQAAFDVHSAGASLFIFVLEDDGSGIYETEDILGFSESFNGEMLAAAAGSSLSVTGDVSADIAVAGTSTPEVGQ